MTTTVENSSSEHQLDLDFRMIITTGNIKKRWKRVMARSGSPQATSGT